MGTGIVSVALSLDGRETLSRILLVVAALAWIALVLRALVVRRRLLREARLPGALSEVAGTAVLGTRLGMLGWSWAGIVLLVAAVAGWMLLLPPVLRHLPTPTNGASLLLTVSTESLGVLSATVAQHERAGWLLHAALVPLVLGLGFYLFVLARFDARELGRGQGDHWITGCALAIAALAGGKIAQAARSLHTLGGGTGALKWTALVLWLLAIAWLPLLLAAETLRPRLRYDARRWSTVFPVGMYAACSFVVGSVASAPAITRFARVGLGRPGVLARYRCGDGASRRRAMSSGSVDQTRSTGSP